MKWEKEYDAGAEILDKGHIGEYTKYMYFDGENIISTNGKILLSVPCEEKELEGLFISKKAALTLRKKSKKQDVQVERIKTTKDGNQYQVTLDEESIELEGLEENPCKYPKYKPLVKEADNNKKVYRTKLSTEVLERLIKASKKMDVSNLVFSFSARVDNPIVITGNLPEGEEVKFLLMPRMSRNVDDFGLL